MTGQALTLTATYSRLRCTLRSVGRAHGLTPLAVRVLLAIADRAQPPTYDELAADLGLASSGIRRAFVNELYPGGFVDGEATGGGRRRAGVLSRVTLLSRGRRAVLDVRRQVQWNTTPTEEVDAA